MAVKELDILVHFVYVFVHRAGIFWFSQSAFPHGGFLSLVFSLEVVGQLPPKFCVSVYVAPSSVIYCVVLCLHFRCCGCVCVLCELL